MKLSVTLIVKDEEKNLARLLPQLRFADEVIVVDTGSTDGTVSVAAELGAKVFYFKWCGDFAKARNYALKQASGEYVMWLDADDILPEKSQNTLMGWKNTAQPADFYYMRYRMDGDFPFWFWRERLMRKCPQCRFCGFIHEAVAPFGRVAYLDCEAVHKPTATHETRNLAIYRDALAMNRRFSLRDKYYYARTLLENGLMQEALPILHAFAGNSRAALTDRVGAYKLLARCHMAAEPRLALQYLTRSVRLLPPDGEVCCLFGQVYFDAEQWFPASEWYRMALAVHSRSGFVNEYYTGFLPNVQLSVCLWKLGDVVSARAFHLSAKSIAPHNATIMANDMYFR